VSPAAAAALFLGSLALSVASSVALARQLDRIAVRLGMTEALVGIVTALGADAPEISSAVTAVARGHEDTGVGVVLGSNVFNLAALLGLSAVVAGQVRIHPHGLVLNGGVAIAVAAIGSALVLGWTGPVSGLLLALAVFVPYLVLSALAPSRFRRLPALRQALAEEQEDAYRAERVRPATGLDALTVAPALAAVVLGSIGMVAAAQSLGERWGVSDVVIGTLVLASLTGIPNVIGALRLAAHGRGAAVVSESLNSNNANVAIGLCVPALLLGIGGSSGLEQFGAWSMVGMTTLAVILLGVGRRLTRAEGCVIIALYVTFAVLVATL
jgi:cation:H+ antiporter